MLDELQRGGSRDRQGDDRGGEHDDAAQRQDRQAFRNDDAARVLLDALQPDREASLVAALAFLPVMPLGHHASRSTDPSSGSEYTRRARTREAPVSGAFSRRCAARW